MIGLFIQLLEMFGFIRPLRTLVQVDIDAGWTGTATRAVLCETAGLLKVDAETLGTGILVPVAAGVPVAIAVTKIYSTGDGSTVTGAVVAGS